MRCGLCKKRGGNTRTLVEHAEREHGKMVARGGRFYFDVGGRLVPHAEVVLSERADPMAGRRAARGKQLAREGVFDKAARAERMDQEGLKYIVRAGREHGTAS